YVSLCAVSETKLVPIECEIKSSFRLDTRELEEKITDRSKLLVLNSPNNPTGSVLSRKTLEDIAEIAIKNDLLVLSDECYEKFIYGGGEHVSIASIPGMSQRTITIGSSSKTYAMTGWRVGYIVVPDSLLPYVLRMHSIICTCVGTFNQYGYMEALRHAENDVRNMIAEYEKRRELVLGYMKQMPILDFAVPEGAFYFFPNVSKTGMNSTEFCSYMLNEAGVAMVPGDVFHGVDSVRFAYCKPIDYLRSAMERFKAAIDKI
ncbi:MAG: aminotransferase class I/II-fold pyridoxal phosphate-dependent enzyme, partial [Synergistaceae bacterium]|nr:aminotransferase class I/II-fold pyridoxal phosphate-dependent enzyme [Synergistaceae bacterium]